MTDYGYSDAADRAGWTVDVQALLDENDSFEIPGQLAIEDEYEAIYWDDMERSGWFTHGGSWVEEDEVHPA